LSRLRHQLPVYSPIPAAAVLGGLRAALRPARGLIEDIHDQLKTRFGARDVLLTDSGTTALRIAIVAAQTGPGPVALPAYGCYDLATAADGAGCRVALYDVDAAVLGPDMNSLSAALKSGAKVVVVAHLYGYPVDVPAIQRLCDAAGALVLEDAAQGAGGTLAGRLLGSFGTVTMLSFARGKGVTGGGGGALLAFDDGGAAVLSRAKSMLGAADRGWTRLAALAAQWCLARPQIYGIPAGMPWLRLGETVYRTPGRPRHAPPATLGVLARTLPNPDRELAVRRKHAVRLTAAIAASGAFTSMVPIPGADPGYLRLPAMCTGSRRPASLLTSRLGVEAAYPKSLADLEGFKHRIEGVTSSFSGARALAARLITVPTHGRLEERDLEALETWLAAQAR